MARVPAKKTNPHQIVDIVQFPFLPVCENSYVLRHLTEDRKLSLGRISEITGHSRSHLRRKLKSFGLEEKRYEIHRPSPYGWRWIGGKLVENLQEQQVIAKIQSLHEQDLGSRKIARQLNTDGVLTRRKKRWSPQFVCRVILRIEKAKKGGRMDPP